MHGVNPNIYSSKPCCPSAHDASFGAVRVNDKIFILSMNFFDCTDHFNKCIKFAPYSKKTDLALKIFQKILFLRNGNRGFRWSYFIPLRNCFFIKSYYSNDEGVLQVGLYGAASTLANFYIGILISSMATEFFPSLIQAANDRPAMNRLLSQQTLLAICIGVPVSLVMLILSPWILGLLYTRDFIAGSR